MKIKIINGEQPNENNFLDISNYIRIKDLKQKLDEVDHINTSLLYSQMDLIYKNFILNDEKLLTFYKISSEDEIWMGKIQNFLKIDEFILEVFVTGLISEFLYLIVKRNQKLSDICKLLESIISDMKDIKIWNKNGQQLEIEDFVDKFDENDKYHKIILSFSQEKIEKSIENYQQFFQCCQIHDQLFLEQYAANYRIDFMLYVNLIRMKSCEIKIVKYFFEFILSDYSNYKYLEEKISDLPESFQNSKFLFYTTIANSIYRICKKYWEISKEKNIEIFEKTYKENPFDVFWAFDKFDHYFLVALLFSLNSYQASHQMDKSMKNILDDASHFMTDPTSNWNDSTKLLWNQFFLTKICDNDIKSIINKSIQMQNTLPLQIPHSEYEIIKLSPEIKTVRDLKRRISLEIGVSTDEMYLIKLYGNQQPENEDNFNLQEIYNYCIQIVSSMEDIEILGNLGFGAYGNVKLCKNKFSTESFALKIPNIQTSFSEINIHNQLNKSPDILKLVGLIYHNGSICMALEYFSKGSLTSKIRDLQRFSDQQIAEIAHPILKQLKCLHDDEIIHGDVKCNNVVFDNNDCAKLIDFGLSKCINGLSKEKLKEYIKPGKPGTNIYMAPELLNGESYSYKIDIWSFGVMMVEMVLGKSPYVNNPPYNNSPFAFIKIAKSRKIDYEPPYLLSSELKDFIDDCLESEPDKRATVDELLESEFLKKNFK